jgi:hypothetical protein
MYLEKIKKIVIWDGRVYDWCTFAGCIQCKSAPNRRSFADKAKIQRTISTGKYRTPAAAASTTAGSSRQAAASDPTSASWRLCVSCRSFVLSPSTTRNPLIYDELLMTISDFVIDHTASMTNGLFSS